MQPNRETLEMIIMTVILICVCLAIYRITIVEKQIEQTKAREQIRMLLENVVEIDNDIIEKIWKNLTYYITIEYVDIEKGTVDEWETKIDADGVVSNYLKSRSEKLNTLFVRVKFEGQDVMQLTVEC